MASLPYISPEEITALENKMTVLDYFQRLQIEGLVNFTRKTGHDYYFTTPESKFSVTETGFFDFKTGEGGQLIKAVMTFENVSWRQAVERIRQLTESPIKINATTTPYTATKTRKHTHPTKPTTVDEFRLLNPLLVDYFTKRGIDPDILSSHTKELHYKMAKKSYFGIGTKNLSGGYEIRNPYMKTKLGSGDISIIYGDINSDVVVFEGMSDTLSYLQLLKDNKRRNDKTLVTLNSVANVGKFIERFRSNKARIYLLLDGDIAGTTATNKVQEAFTKNRAKDVRHLYKIGQTGGPKDLNEYLKLKRKTTIDPSIELATANALLDFTNTTLTNIQKAINFYGSPEGRKNQTPDEINILFQAKADKLVQIYSATQAQWNDAALNGLLQTKKSLEQKINQLNKKEDGHTRFESQQLPDSSNLGQRNLAKNTPTDERSKQSQSGSTNGGPTLPSSTTGIGSSGTTTNNSGRSRGSATRGNRDRTQSSTGSEISKMVAGLRRRDSELRSRRGTGLPDVDSLLTKSKGHPTNEIINELVHLSTELEGDEIKLKDGLKVTEDLKITVSLFQNGGKLKQGRGILDEYYTNEQIVLAINNLIRANFPQNKPISILEPSVGTGNFLKLTQTWPQKQGITAFEINDTTARIAKILYPQAQIHTRPFETEFIQENGSAKPKETFEKKYDLVIGNPPYGQHRGYYKGLGEEPKIARYEDYFVKRSLDSLKEGGILAMVLPSGWIERQNKLRGADLMQAFRLPVGAFRNTQVGTDIIILQKRERIQSHDISNYFTNNPSRILGEEKQRTNRFGRMEKYVSGDLDSALVKIADIQSQKETPKLSPNTKEYIPDLFGGIQPLTIERPAKKDSSTKAENPTAPPISKEVADVRKSIEDAISAIDATTFKTSATQNSREKLSRALDTIENTGQIPEELSDIKKTADRITDKLKTHSDYLLQSTPEIKRGIIKYQFLKKDSTAQAASQNKDDISTEEREAFLDTNYAGLFQHPDKFKKFANYIDGLWMHDFYYTEGNIYKKLHQLEVDFSGKLGNPISKAQYEKQQNLLLSSLPTPKTLDQIIISPNHEFVHSFITGTREEERYNYEEQTTEKVSVPYSLADQFTDFISNLSQDAFSGSSYWEVRSFVNNETVTGSDKERNNLVRERRKEAANELFTKFLHQELPEDLKKRFVREFNENYNSINVPDYSHFPLFSEIHANFKGAPLRLTEVQKAGIGQLTTKGVGLLAHEVGFGKTLSGIITLHEAMHRGNAKRPLIVVPNDNIMKQWIETLYEVIPEVKVNVLGNLGAQYDLANFKVKDGEISLVTYSGFNNIGFSQEVTDRLAAKFSYITEKETANVKHSVRDEQIELQKQEELKGTMKRGKIYDWEDFGFDHLTFDEVHNANHIVGKVRIEDRRFASDFRSQQQRTSAIGINTWMAAQYIQEQNNGRNVTLLSATPFTNKPLEYYSILSLVANQRLEELGFFNVNTFFETFMEADNDMEINALGGVQYKTNVRRFKNNTLFQKLLSEFIDIKGSEDNPDLVRPQRLNKEYKIDQNDKTRDAYDMLNTAFDPEKDGALLTHILNARLVALSPYLSPLNEDPLPEAKQFIENSPKLKLTMDLIAQNKNDKPEAGQLIYSELAISSFPKLKEYLINQVGYKSTEVEIISGATSKKQRIKIQDQFNEGKVKVVIGSSAIQEGMNLQQNTTDLYLLSLPYNFTALRQVEGRAWRQGNKWPSVRINYMLTADSIDVFMLQKLQSKQSRYIEAMQKGADVLDISDINTSELKTALITDPHTRAEIEIKVMEKRLEKEKEKYLADSAFMLRKFKTFTEAQQKLNDAKKSLESDREIAKRKPESDYWRHSVERSEATVKQQQEALEFIIENLGKKGVNVNEIKEQTAFTDAKLEEIEEKKEKLPEIKERLAQKYEEERKISIKGFSTANYLSARQEENKTFYGSAAPKRVEKKVAEQKTTVGRKR